jgi:formamidopyrimidine-DNA glycosylase
LLDQAVVAGLGNIYVDELLFRMGLPPSLPAGDLDPGSVKPLVSKMRRLLLSAIRSGGSTLRDYADGDGQQGGFQLKHRVYGRAGLPCRRCKRLLIAAPIAGRTTVWCEKCQPEIKPAG